MLDKVYTITEAMELWGIENRNSFQSNIARGIISKPFREAGFIRKAEGTKTGIWLIHHDAMVSLYGPMKKKQDK